MENEVDFEDKFTNKECYVLIIINLKLFASESLQNDDKPYLVVTMY